MTIEELRSKGVFFHPTVESFSYTSLCVASGLMELGIPVFSSLNFSNPQVSDFKFTIGGDPNEAGILVIDLQEKSFMSDFPYHVNSPHPNTHLLAICDTVDHLNYSGPIPVHRAHSSRLLPRRYRHFPVAFGISDKIRDYAQGFCYPEKREDVAIRNFRPSANQFVRLSLDLGLVPLLERTIPVDRRLSSGSERWHATHLDRLGKSLMCLAYGGNFMDDYSSRMERDLEPTDPRYEFLTQNKIFQAPAIIRWDSWRFWESMAMGCLTIQLDFEKYGMELPVMPENWKHYVGIAFDSLEADVERLMDERDRIPEIARAGQEWALKYYTSRPVAERFLRNAGVEF